MTVISCRSKLLPASLLLLPLLPPTSTSTSTTQARVGPRSRSTAKYAISVAQLQASEVHYHRAAQSPQETAAGLPCERNTRTRNLQAYSKSRSCHSGRPTSARVAHGPAGRAKNQSLRVRLRQRRTTTRAALLHFQSLPTTQHPGGRLLLHASKISADPVELQTGPQRGITDLLWCRGASPLSS